MLHEWGVFKEKAFHLRSIYGSRLNGYRQSK